MKYQQYVRLAVIGAALALVSCGDDGGGGGPADVGGIELPGNGAMPVVVPQFAQGAVAGTVANPSIVEASGIVPSKKTPNVFWVHNDSGDGPNLYAMTTAGAHLRQYVVSGASASDWEDMTIGPGPVAGEWYLYAGDIGSWRPNITIYRMVEPVVTAGGTTTISGAQALQFTYPDGGHDAEALIVDPVNGDLYIVSKDASAPSRVYRAPAPLTSGTTLQDMGALDMSFSTSNLLTGGEVSPQGDLVVLRTYEGIAMWARQPGRLLGDAFFDAPAVVCPQVDEPQGEAICFSASGNGYYTLSEGQFRPIYFFARLP